MRERLVEALTVQPDDLLRIRPLLEVMLKGLIVATAAGTVVFVGAAVIGQRGFWVLSGLNLLMLIVMIGIGRLNQRGHTNAAIHTLLAVITLYVTVASPPGFLVAGPELAVYAVPITAAGLLLTPAAAGFWAVITTIAALARMIVVTLFLDVVVSPIALTLGVIVLYLLALSTWLFARSLQQANRNLRRRIGQIQTGAEISRVVTAALEPGLIQWPAVQLIQTGFGYYHVGFYVLDPEGRWAVLTEAAGEAADRMKQEEHRLPLDGSTVVAAAFAQRARQMLVLGEEGPYSPNGRPLQPNDRFLPQTRAELALPLQVGERLLGVLDVHSTQPLPFPDEEIEALEGIVGQVAVALENAHLFEDLHQRHQELRELHQQTERRARYLEATAELARAVSSLLDLQALLDRAVNLISERFGFYHAGIFLVDEAGEWAVLQAANSEGGQRMLARGHKLRVGEQGIVGWVTHAGEPRIALDVGEDAVHFDNPDLPNTRSEMALPLRVGDRVIGALDIQSTREAAFSEEDVAVLQTLADQIAIAIENARLFQETQRALEEVQTLHRYYLAQAWEQFTRQRRDLSAEYRRLGVPPLERAWSPEMEIALAQERPVVLTDLEAELLGGDGQEGNRDDGTDGRSALPARSVLAVPIKLRGEVIGVLDLQATEESRRWTDEEVAMVAAVADQMALALENARLLEAERDQRQVSEALREAAVALSSTLEFDDLVQRILEQISRVVPGDASNLMLIEGDEVRVVGRRGYEHFQFVDLLRERRVPRDTLNTLRKMAETGRPVVIPDTASDPDWRLLPGSEWIRSYVGAPIQVRGEIIGLLNVDSATPGFFTQEHADRLAAFAAQAGIALQNARLFEETRRHAREVRQLYQLGMALSATLDLEEALQTVADGARELLEASSAAVYYWDEGTQRYTYRFSLGETHLDAEGLFQEPRPGGMTETIHRTGEPVLVEDVRLDPRVASHVVEAGVRSFVGVPIQVGGRRIGVVFANGEQPGQFGEHEQNLLTFLASQAAIALQNARLFEEVQTRARHEHALREITAVINTSESLVEELPVIAGHLRQLVPVDTLALTIYVPGESEYTLFAVEVSGERTPFAQRGARLPVEGTGPGWVLTHGEPWIDDDLRQQLSFVEDEHVLAQGLRSRAILPLRVGERVIGTLNLASTQPGVFTETDLPPLRLIAGQMALALERVRLFEETQQRARDLDKLYQATRVISTELDLEPLAEKLAEEARNLVEAHYSGILIFHPNPDQPVYFKTAGVDLDRFQLSGRPEGKGVLAAILEGEAVRLDDISKHPRSVGLPPEHFPLKRLLGLPIVYHGQVRGILLAGRDANGAPFTEADFSLLQALAASAAVAVENARLFLKTQEALAETEVLYRASRAIAVAQTPEDVLRAFTDHIVTPEIGRCVLALIDPGSPPDQREVEIVAAWEPGVERPAVVGNRWNASQIPLIDRIGQDPLVISDVETASEMDEVSRHIFLDILGIRAFIAIPMLVGERLLGWLLVESLEGPYEFSERERRLYEALAGQAAVALERQRLFEEAQRRARRERLIREITTKVRAATDVDTILQTALQEISQALGTTHAAIRLGVQSPEFGNGGSER